MSLLHSNLIGEEKFNRDDSSVQMNTWSSGLSWERWTGNKDDSRQIEIISLGESSIILFMLPTVHSDTTTRGKKYAASWRYYVHLLSIIHIAMQMQTTVGRGTSWQITHPPSHHYDRAVASLRPRAKERRGEIWWIDSQQQSHPPTFLFYFFFLSGQSAVVCV